MTSIKKCPAPSVEDGNGADIEAFSEAIDSGNDNATDLSPQAKWNAENPLARWAQQCLRSALKRGLVERKPCEVCGAEPADGHHDDYDKPMAVRWLCRLHHRQHHAVAKTEGGAK